MINFLDQAWRVLVVALILAVWGLIVGACTLFDKGVDYFEEM